MSTDSQPAPADPRHAALEAMKKAASSALSVYYIIGSIMVILFYRVWPKVVVPDAPRFWTFVLVALIVLWMFILYASTISLQKNLDRLILKVEEEATQAASSDRGRRRNIPERRKTEAELKEEEERRKDIASRRQRR